MISNKLRKKTSTPGYRVCPKCNGKGEKKYKVHDVSNILTGIANIKKGQSIRDVRNPVYVIIIECVLCQGTGEVEWISIVTEGHLKKRYSDYEGCLVIFERLTCVWLFDEVKNLHSGKLKFKNLEYLIESSRKRYDCPIKLNESILGKDPEELLDIVWKIDCFWDEFFSIEPSEDYIDDWLKENGLYQYKPDKYAYPEAHDFPYLM